MVPCDILLISPPSIAKLRRPPRQQQVSKDGYVPPLGLCYLAAVLERAGYHVDLIDMQAENLRANACCQRSNRHCSRDRCGRDQTFGAKVGQSARPVDVCSYRVPGA